ncbi:hypothetical protein FOMPIDRAFT_1013333 [Fomitopsis schrenkii]|uniref:Uncharacterized protein n=1 Tax=Fomitopsis schrenkii TaxID=2126942 RepID=S8EN61_FOMSC|nr:hypothetical protein FOMPIDRAFT_1013333 [Fomitopsis schrenkii]
MPTVPPTFVASAAYHHGVPTVPGPAPFSVGSFLDRERDDAASGPTPDPDTEDFAIVPMENGNAVTEPGPERPPAHSSAAALSGPHTSRQSSPPARNSRFSLGALSLNSPSSAIIGTPFDLSPRFEYPFPSSASTDVASSVFDHDSVPYPYGHPLFGAYGHRHVLGWAGLPVSSSLPNLSSTAGFPIAAPPGHPSVMGPGAQRIQVPTHPKLSLREPPIPPSLTRKRYIMREQEIEPRSEANLNQRRGVSGITPPRRTFTEQELADTTDVDAVRQQGLPLPSVVAIPRPPSLERRESDETVVGSVQGHGEKGVLDELCSPSGPAVALITSAEDTQVEFPTLGAIITEEPEVKPTTVADVQPVQGDARTGADVSVPSHGYPTPAVIDVSDARLDTLPAFPLATIAISSSAVCTAGFCPVFEEAPPPTHDPSIDARVHTVLRQGAGHPHEPHDYDCKIHDTPTEEASVPIYDGARLPSDDSAPAPAPAPADSVATPTDS